MKLTKKQQDLEYIIEILSRHPSGLTTGEIQELLSKNYQREKTGKSIWNHLVELSEGAVDNVECYPKKRQKHQLKDNRLTLKEKEKLRNKEQLIAEEQAYMRLALEAIKKLDNLSKKHHRIIEERFRLNKIESPYFIESDPHEEIEINDPDIVTLKTAIQKAYLTAFKYTGESSHNYYVVEPYKLMIFDGVWYLFGKDTQEREQTPYKTWRLKYICDVEFDTTAPKHRMDMEMIEETLSDALDSEFVIDEIREEEKVTLKIIHDIPVKLKISKKIMHDFDHKAHLPGTIKEVSEESDGSLHVTTMVSCYEDIEQEVKKWLPHIEIILPETFRQKLKEELTAYLARMC